MEGIMSSHQRFQFMQPQIIPVLLLALLLAAIPSTLIAKASAEGDFHTEYDAAGLTEIDVETINGSIEVIGNNGDKVIIDARLKVTGKKQEVCDELLEEIEIKVKPEGNQLHIEAELQGKRKYSQSVSFKIIVPQRMGADLETVNGSIDVTSIDGGSNVETINGSINCSNVAGNVDAETINGSINLADVTEKADAETINGSISYQSTVSSPKSLDFETINGKISVDLHRIPDAKLAVSAVNGKIKINGVPDIELKKGARSFNGIIGSGEGDYNFSTVNGSITLNVKEAD